jgi:dTDP-4-dehydrorhamnose reductase
MIVEGTVAVTGSNGRLGRALISELGAPADGSVVAWSRPEFDLDASDPEARAIDLLDRDRPTVVLHAAAWTDVDGCARDPETANRRNGSALGGLARACVRRGVRLLAVSTNEVFDGTRADGVAYLETDAVAPANPYGASKLLGEEAAQAAFDGRPGLLIARTAWLYGPPGNDFPTKIVAASDKREETTPGEALPVVVDEVGNPTFTKDLAAALVGLAASGATGVFHLVNAGDAATRYSWAEAVLAQCRPGRSVRPILRSEFVRASNPPAWGVLNADKAAAAGVTLRSWTDALREYLTEAC